MNKYSQLLSRTTEQKNQSEVSEKVERTDLSLQNTILNTKGSVKDLANGLNKALASYPVEWNNVLDAKRKLQIAEANLADLLAIKEEYFSATTEEASAE
jgi:hypothetical protein